MGPGRCEARSRSSEQLGLSGAADEKDLTDWIVKRGGPSKAVDEELFDRMARHNC